MADVFHEVDEQLRSARLQSLVRRGWPYAAGLVAVGVALALGAYGLNQHEQQQAAAASERYAAASEALTHGDLDGAESQFAALAASAPGGYRALSLMQEAGIRLTRNQPDAALDLLDRAAQAAPNVVVGDAARLEAAYLAMNAGDLVRTRARLEPLAATGRPYRLMAREALGLAELAAGRLAEARGDLQVVSLSSDATDMARNRASAALELLRSGAWTGLASIAKASAGLQAQTPPPQAAGAGGAPGQPSDDQAAQAQAAQAQAAQGQATQATPPQGQPQTPPQPPGAAQ